jgi:hypothetical protein
VRAIYKHTLFEQTVNAFDGALVRLERLAEERLQVRKKGRFRQPLQKMASIIDPNDGIDDDDRKCINQPSHKLAGGVALNPTQNDSNRRGSSMFNKMQLESGNKLSTVKKSSIVK